MYYQKSSKILFLLKFTRNQDCYDELVIQGSLGISKALFSIRLRRLLFILIIQFYLNFNYDMDNVIKVRLDR
jgi:hypothetical protein